MKQGAVSNNHRQTGTNYNGQYLAFPLEDFGGIKQRTREPVTSKMCDPFLLQRGGRFVWPWPQPTRTRAAPSAIRQPAAPSRSELCRIELVKTKKKQKKRRRKTAHLLYGIIKNEIDHKTDRCTCTKNWTWKFRIQILNYIPHWCDRYILLYVTWPYEIKLPETLWIIFQILELYFMI